MDLNGHELLEEILTDPHFPKWARGKAPEYNQYWEEWVGNDIQRKELLATAKGVILAIGSQSLPMSDEYIFQKVQNAVSSSASDTGRSIPEKILRYPFQRLVRVAAVLSLVSLLGWGLMKQWPTQDVSVVATTQDTPASEIIPQKMIHVRNPEKEPKFVQLADGSGIILQQNSELKYPAVFASGKREVYLSGEAFFEVSHDANAPFYVHANKAITKVLGTSFKIKALPNTTTIHVAVKTGKVAVFTEAEHQSGALKNNPNPTFLRQNEAAEFEISENKLKRKKEFLAKLEVMPIEILNFQYDAAPISNVLNDLQSAYGVKIVYNEEQVYRCTISGNLNGENLAQKIEWICTILEATHTIEGNQITINAKPCL